MEHSSRNAISRRKLLRNVAIASALPALSQGNRSESSDKLKICVFSKHFQWTDVKETAAIAKDLGFDGVDLTVRKGGHVLPERGWIASSRVVKDYMRGIALKDFKWAQNQHSSTYHDPFDNRSTPRAPGSPTGMQPDKAWSIYQHSSPL